MKKYSVIIENSAQADIQSSYDWGCRVWGKAQACTWMRELRAAILGQLGTIPNGFPFAPESDEFQKEIRQLMVGRYRVLFTIQARTVHVLHVRGAYVGSIESDVSDE